MAVAYITMYCKLSMLTHLDSVCYARVRVYVRVCLCVCV